MASSTRPENRSTTCGPGAASRTYVLDTSRAAVRPAGDHPVRGARGGAARSWWSPSWRPSGTTRSWATSPARRCGCSTTCASGTAGSTRPVPVGDEGGTLRVELNHTDPTVAAGRLPARRQRHPHPRGGPATSPTRASTSRSSARTCRCGSRPRRCGLEAEEYRAELAVDVRLDRHGRARRHRRGDGRALRARPDRDAEAAELPCHTGLVLLSPRGSASGPGRRRQAGAARARRPRRVRAARPQRRAAHRARPPARPRRGHRLPRRPRRHRQVRARAVRRPRGGHGAPPAAQGRRLPPAVRRRWPGARLPARHASPRRWAPGARRCSTRLGALVSHEVVEEIIDRGMLEVLPLTHIRGRSLHDAFVIVDEAQ